MKKIFLFFLLVFAYAGVTAHAAEITLKIQPGPEEGVDTYFGIGSVGGSEGRPDATQLRIGGWGDEWLSYVKFDLNALPSELEISNAKLGLYNSTEKNPNEGKVYMVTSTWQESDPSVGNQPEFRDAGIDYSQVPNLDWWIVDITNMVSDWYGGIEANNGLLLRGKYTSNDVVKHFISSDYLDDPSLRPYLEITYTVPDEPEEPEEPEEPTVGELVEELKGEVENLSNTQVQRFFQNPVRNIERAIDRDNAVVVIQLLDVLERRVGLFERIGRVTSAESEQIVDTIAALKKAVTAEDEEEAGDILLTQIASPLVPGSEDWESDLLGNGAESWCGNTIGECGCVITSLAMLAKHQGIEEGVDGKEINPRNLNNWLQENEGYTATNGVWWGRALQYFGEGDGRGVIHLDSHNEENQSVIRDAVSDEGPAIGFKASKGHYFVLESVREENDFNVKDPYWYETETLNEIQDAANNVQAYGGEIDKANLFRYSDRPERLAGMVEVELASPAELLIVDNEGRRAGYDPATGEVYEEIPGSSYEQSELIFSSDVAPEDAHPPKRLTIIDPEQRMYDLQVVGTGEGEYTLSVGTTGEGGTFEASVTVSSTTPEQVDEYVVEIPQKKRRYRAVWILRQLADRAGREDVADRLNDIADRLGEKNIARVEAGMSKWWRE